jgi:hypothetical protein
MGGRIRSGSQLVLLQCFCKGYYVRAEPPSKALETIRADTKAYDR